jgi:hypothetical protein
MTYMAPALLAAFVTKNITNYGNLPEYDADQYILVEPMYNSAPDELFIDRNGAF